MGDIHQPTPVLLLLPAFSRYDEAFDWARERAIATWGPIAGESERFQFDQTTYYESTMGPGLKKCFWTFAQLIDPAELPGIKRLTNEWEAEYARLAGHAESRPLNLDPGYLTLAKLVLASTKDHAHRIYLAQGIYAEVTLSYRQGRWQPHEWTFPDYRRDDYQQFFTEARKSLHERQREGGAR